MEFNNKDCAWSNISITVLGRKILGLRGFEVKKSVEKEHVYGSGDEPVDIQTGNKKYEGNLKLLKYEVDLMNDAAKIAGFADITEVPHTLVALNIEFKKLIAGSKRNISVPGVAFTELPIGLEQNSKMSEVTIPFIAMRVVFL